MNLIRFNHHPSFSNIFNTFEKNILNDLPQDRGDIPAVNIKEDDKQFLMEMAIPGFNKKDFKVNVEEQLLTISSEQEDKKEEKSGNYTRKEFSFSGFSRSFSLPKTIMVDDIKAEYENGILSIALPKKEEVKMQREISIA